MKRLTAVTALFLCFAAPAMAQWSWIHPRSQGNSLNDIVFLDENTAIAVGNASTVMRTSDAGMTWSRVTATYFRYQFDFATISRIDDDTAIATADVGYIARTDDAGLTWTVWEGPVMLLIPLDAEFCGSVGLLASQANKLYRSGDGGVTWSVVLDGPRSLAIDFISESSVVVVADDAFLRSEDGGLTWTSSPFPSVPVDWDKTSISFADALHGAVAKDQHFYYTSDGGLSWSESMLDAAGGLFTQCSELEMIDASTIVVSARHGGCDATGDCRLSGQFLRSSDSGSTWESDWGPRQFEGLADNGNGVVLAVGSGGSIFRRTISAWEKEDGTDFERLESRSAAAFTDPQHGIVVGVIGGAAIATNKSVVLRTDNGGAAWTSTELLDTEIADVAFSPDGGTAYAVGRQSVDGSNHRMILRSLDGGTSWSLLWSASALPSRLLRSVAFGSNSRAIATGFTQSAIVIDNGIVTEHLVSGGSGFAAVAFADPTTAVVAGGPASFFRSTDGGDSWTPASVPVNINVEDLAFATPQIGVAVGSNYWVRTTDGGVTWQPIASPIYGAHGIGFGPGGYGIAVKLGYDVDPRAAETMDHGATWTPIETPPSPFTKNVTVFAPHHAIVAGPDLNVFQYLRVPVPTAITSFRANASAFAVELTWSVRDALELSELRIRRTENELTSVFGIVESPRGSFRDESVVPGTEYEYTLIAIDNDGTEIQSAPIRVTTSNAELELLPNVPNPFNPSTTIRYILPSRERVRVTIYDVVGRAVTTLVDREESAGQYSVPWNGTDANGERVASGVYLIRIEAGKHSLSRKMVLLK